MSLSDDDGSWQYDWESEMRTRRELIRGNPIGALVNEIERLQKLPTEKAVVQTQALPAAIPFIVNSNNPDGIWKADKLAEWLISKVSKLLALPEEATMNGLDDLRVELIRDGGPMAREAAVRLCLTKMIAIRPALQAFSPPR